MPTKQKFTTLNFIILIVGILIGSFLMLCLTLINQRTSFTQGFEYGQEYYRNFINAEYDSLLARIQKSDGWQVSFKGDTIIVAK